MIVATDEDALLGGHVKLKTTAEHLVYLLAAHGVEYLFLNPGTDTAPVQEAVYTLAEAGLPVPTVLLSTFESVSLAAAHAYWKMTGRPQAVFVHVDAGTQNLGAMVHNVLRDRAGVVVIAGKTPYGEEDGPSGGRNAPIQWQQDVPDQPGIIRGYAKWVQEITRPEMLDRAIGRAVQVAASSPAGHGVPDGVPRRADGPAAPRPLAGHRASRSPCRPRPPRPRSQRIAAALAAAEAPVLVTSRVGRTAEGFAAVEALADLAGLPVTGRLEGGPVNISSRHPASLPNQAAAAAAVSAADVILRGGERRAVAARHGDAARGRPGLPRRPRPGQGLDAAVVLPRRRRRPGRRRRRARRRHRRARRIAGAEPEVAERFADRVAAAAGARGRAGRAGPDSGPLTPRGVMSALNQVIDAEDIVVEEAVTNAAAVYEGLERTRPGTLTGPRRPRARLGARRGARGEAGPPGPPGDHGDRRRGVPVRRADLGADDGGRVGHAVPRRDPEQQGLPGQQAPGLRPVPRRRLGARRKTAVGTRFNWAPDYPALAAACHAHGERVEKAEDLVPALRRAACRGRRRPGRRRRVRHRAGLAASPQARSWVLRSVTPG